MPYFGGIVDSVLIDPTIEISLSAESQLLAVVFGNLSALPNRAINFFTLFAGVFLAVSSNTRYQIINGLERLVEASPVARQVPSVAMAFTVGIRFANNVYGGMQFVDWARWSGVQ